MADNQNALRSRRTISRKLSVWLVILHLFFKHSPGLCDSQTGHLLKNGTIESDNYPLNYPHNLHRIWRISFSELAMVTLEFESFSLEDSGPYCKGDYLAIYRGHSETEHGLVSGKKLCETLPTNLQINIPMYEMVAIFHTDSTESAEGFRMKYAAMSLGPNATCELMRRVHGSTEEISSLFVGNYEGNPARYPKVIDCAWNLETNISYELSLDVRLLPDMIGENCTHNYLEVRISVALNGSENVSSWELTLRDNATDLWFPKKVASTRSVTDFGVLSGRLCGDRASPSVYKASAKMVNVIFHSDFAIEGGYFTVTSRPINPTRQANTTLIHHIDILKWTPTEGNVYNTTPPQILNFDVVVDAITWTIQTHPGFIIRYEITSTDKADVAAGLYVFDAPTTDPRSKLEIPGEQTGVERPGYSSGFYLSLLCTGISESCPLIKYKSLNVFTDSSHPFHVEHTRILYRQPYLFEYIRVSEQCCSYSTFIHGYALSISNVSRISVKTNADNCRHFGVVIYEGDLQKRTQHGPFCEMFEGNIAFMLDDFSSISDTIHVVVYMYGDHRSHIHTDLPLLSFYVCDLFSFHVRNMHDRTPGPRILEYKDRVTTTIHRLQSMDEDSCGTFFLSGQVFADSSVIKLDRQYYIESWSALCALTSDSGEPAYLYTEQAWAETFIKHHRVYVHVTSRIVGPQCDHPQLIKYYIMRFVWGPTLTEYYCDQNHSITHMPGAEYVLIADQRHRARCYWYLQYPVYWYRHRRRKIYWSWRIRIDKFSVKKGSDRSSLDRLTITLRDYRDQADTYMYQVTNVRYPRVITTRSSYGVRIEATSEYHLDINIHVQLIEIGRRTTMYHFYAERNVSWVDAQNYCSRRNKKLLYLNSVQELDRLRGYGRYIYDSETHQDIRLSGLTFVGVGGTNGARDGYRWTDGSPLTFADWYQPFDDHDNFVSKTSNVQADTIQPTADVDKVCVAAEIPMLLNTSWNWHKIACTKKSVKALIICKDVEDRAITKRNDLVSNVSCLPYHFCCDDGTCLTPDSRCNKQRDCLSGEDEENCDYGENIFTCGSGEEIHVSMSCDGRKDCGDNSDEEGCQEEDDCFHCSAGFCLPTKKRCDGLIHCPSGNDEINCTDGKICTGYLSPIGDCIPHHKRYDMVPDCSDWDQPDERIGFDFNLGKTNLTWVVEDGQPKEYIKGSKPCPGADAERRCHPEHTFCYPKDKTCMYDRDYYGHLKYCRNGEHLWHLSCQNHNCPSMYKCPGTYCIPYRRVCDGAVDCPDLSDEEDCENYTCPGLFRCRGNVCLSWDEVCDGQVHCPDSSDDERFCEFNQTEVGICPTTCHCEGYHVDCSRRNISSMPDNVPENARTLILHSNTVERLSNDLVFKYLVIFDLSNNNLTRIEIGTFRGMRNLLHLRLHNNSIDLLENSTFANLSRLKSLELQVNPITHIDVGLFSDLTSLIKLNMSNLHIHTLSIGLFMGLDKLEVLDIAGNRIKIIEPGALSDFKVLTQLNITNNTLEELKSNSFEGLSVDEVLTDAFRFCCYVRNNIVKHCSPEGDFTSTCDELLATIAHKVVVWFIGLSAFVGNLVVLVRRCREGLDKVPSILIFNLSLSDMLMGFFLLIIAVADLVFRGEYALQDPYWRSSVLCGFSGVLAMVSNGMSVMMIVFIAIDRALMVVATFGKVKNTRRRTIAAIVVGWVMIICLSALPVMFPDLGNYYGRNAICAPFIFTNLRGPAIYYAMSVFVVPNCLALVVVTVCYVAIFISVKRSGEAAGRKQKYEYKLAKKFAIIIFTDFVTWLPVMLTVVGYFLNSPIKPDEASTVALVVLPINSAVNPYLYTFSSKKDDKAQSQQVGRGRRKTNGRRRRFVPCARV